MIIEDTVGPKVHANVFWKSCQWHSKVQDLLTYITRQTRALSSFLFYEDVQENYTHVCVHTYTQILLYIHICGGMYNIKCILKRPLWSPLVDSVSALVRDNLLKIVVLITVYVITTVNYWIFLRKDNPVPSSAWFTDALETVS